MLRRQLERDLAGPPFAMHCTFICDDETLEGQARHYKQRLLEWQEAHHG